MCPTHPNPADDWGMHYKRPFGTASPIRGGGRLAHPSPPAVAAHGEEIPPDIVPRYDEQEDHARQAGKRFVPGISHICTGNTLVGDKTENPRPSNSLRSAAADFRKTGFPCQNY